MNYQNELQFLLHFFQNHRINICFFQKGMDITCMDLHLRQTLKQEQEYLRIANFIIQQHKPNIISKLIDEFKCVYYCLELPDHILGEFLVIGPYQYNHPTPDDLYHYVETYDVSPQTFQELLKIFSQIPVLLDDTSIQTMIQTFGETIWNGKENFEFQILDQNLEETLYTMVPFSMDNDHYQHFDIPFIESYLTQENALVQAVSLGQTQTAEELLSKITAFPFHELSPEMLRNLKNYAITLDTLLRKTAEFNNINTHQIISTSSKLHQKIEHCSSPEACYTLLRETVRKYCILNKNHTMMEYSPLIQQTIKLVDADLTADLSLHTIAKRLNINASYLSTQFKKVMGTTYTEYVQRKRIEHSIFLLNTTPLQVQTIAQYCGISDLNYFSKLFKKYMSLSPTAYRKEISKYNT